MRHTRLGTIPLRCGLVQAAFPFAALMPRKIVEVKCQLLHVFKVVGLQGMKDKQMKRECYKLRIKSPDPGLPLVTPVSRLTPVSRYRQRRVATGHFQPGY